MNKNNNNNNAMINYLRKTGGKKGVNKYSIKFFEFLLMDVMRKCVIIHCMKHIAKYEEFRGKKYGVKILFRTMKRRTIFYKIKFFHRFKKIYKFIVRYKMK